MNAAARPEETSRRGPSGLRLRLGATVIACALLLPSCARLGHWSGAIASLPAAEGWTPMPLGRWLSEEGARISALSLCPRADCPGQAMVALIELSGRERGAASLLARHPEQFVAQARMAGARGAPGPAQARRPRAAIAVTPVEIGSWRGALLRLGSRAEGQGEAHMALLADPAADPARILLSVAENGEAALGHARTALGR